MASQGLLDHGAAVPVDGSIRLLTLVIASMCRLGGHRRRGIICPCNLPWAWPGWGEDLDSDQPESAGRAAAFRRFLRTSKDKSQGFSIPLIVGVLAGLIVANIASGFYDDLVEFRIFGDAAEVFGREVTLHFLINGIFMVFFFGIAAKEITDSILPGGALNPVKKAINPIMGTLGGVLGPAGLFFLLTFIFFGTGDKFSDISEGWAIPTATDIALAWLVARLVFGRGHPAVNFLLLLAVADDAIGLGIIAVFYPDPDIPVTPAWLLLTAAGVAVALAMRRMRITTWLPYIAIGGALSWVGLAKSGVEPALALVAIVPFLPGPKVAPQQVAHAGSHQSAPGNASTEVHPDGHSPLEQFEHRFKGIVDFGLFFFAFANAGASFSSIDEVTAIVLISLIAGKMIGISLFSALAVRGGFPLPTGMDLRHLAVAGLIAGLGLTVALFVAEKAFPDSPFLEPAKIGAVLSGSVALLAFILGRAFKVKELAASPGAGS